MKTIKGLNKKLIEFENSEVMIVSTNVLVEMFPNTFDDKRITYKNLYNELYEFECENIRYKIKSCAKDHVVWEKNYYKAV